MEFAANDTERGLWARVSGRNFVQSVDEQGFPHPFGVLVEIEEVARRDKAASFFGSSFLFECCGFSRTGLAEQHVGRYLLEVAQTLRK